MFTKIDMHRIERIICDNPLVTCSFVLSVADDNGKLSNVSRFEFHNYNSGQIFKIIGGKKKEFVNNLKLILNNRNSQNQGEIQKRLVINAFGDRKTEISYLHRNYRHVLTNGPTEHITTERLKRLIAFLDWYMEIRLPWIHDGFFDTRVKVSPNQTTEDLVARFIRGKDSKNQPMVICLEKNPDNDQRVFRILNGNSSLVLNDYAEQVPGKDSTTKQVIKRMSDVLLHILNYDQKSHAIDLFSSIDGVNPDLLMYKGYVSLSSDAKHRRVAMNYDQNIMCSKAHWIHERFFTKAVQEALSEIIELY